MFFFLFLACSPRIIRFPGPLLGLGREHSEFHQKSVGLPSKEGEASEDIPQNLGDSIVRSARSFIDSKELKVGDQIFGYHCSGFVTAAFSKSGVQIAGSTKNIFEEAQKKGFLTSEAQPGSLVFLIIRLMPIKMENSTIY